MHIGGLALLVCHTDHIYGTPNSRYGSFAGSWAGDTVVAVGDESTSSNNYGIETTSKQGQTRTLSDMVREDYGNISHKVVIMLCVGNEVSREGDDYDEDDYVPSLVKAAKTDSRLLRTLGSAALTAGYKRLENELLRQCGPGWVDKYRDQMASWNKVYRLG